MSFSEAYARTYFTDSTGRIDYAKYWDTITGKNYTGNGRNPEPPPSKPIQPHAVSQGSYDARMAEALRVNAAFDRNTGRIDVDRLIKMAEADRRQGFSTNEIQIRSNDSSSSIVRYGTDRNRISAQQRFDQGFTSAQPFPRGQGNAAPPPVQVNRGGFGGGMGAAAIGGAAISAIGDWIIRTQGNKARDTLSDWIRQAIGKPPLTQQEKQEIARIQEEPNPFERARKLQEFQQRKTQDARTSWKPWEQGKVQDATIYNFDPSEVQTFLVFVVASRYNRNTGSVANPGDKSLTLRPGEEDTQVSDFKPRIGIPLSIERETADESTPHSTNPQTIDESGMRIVDRFYLVWKNANGEQVRELIGEPVSTASLWFGNFRVRYNSEAAKPFNGGEFQGDRQNGIDPNLDPPPFQFIFAPPPPGRRVTEPPPPPDRRLEPPPPPDRRLEPPPPPDRRLEPPPPVVFAPPPPGRRLEPPVRPPIEPGIDPKPRYEIRQEIRTDQRPNFAPEVNLRQRPNFAPEVNLRQRLDGRVTTDFLKDGKIKPDKIQEIQDKAERRVEPDLSTPPLCQNDCIADLQRGQQNQNQTVTVMVDRFVTWNRLTGAVFVKEPVQVPANMASFAQMMGDRTANIRSRFGLAELRARLTQVMNTLSTAASLHNAAMLSANLGQTLGDVVTQSVQTFAPMFGVDKAAAEAFDFNEVLGKAVNETMENALGAETWNGTKATFTRLNRIVTTASQIVWTVRSIADSSREIAEWTAENTGKIGNALKRFRVVGENAYPWMPERVTAQSKWQQRMQKFRDGQENLDDAASSIASVVGEVRSITEEVNEFREQKEAFDKAIKEATPNSRPDNDSTKATADQSNAASKSPTLQPTDRTKGDAE
ncbi:hypothetical protein Q2T42_21955 [Leptolyngbya boryana CZ1]|uniref:Uncharacterized protein n=1 Tax=Leptolyngbya boryana CZ1 TaxID=3060204 RepID=A0AA97AM29_LEPBY|nr:hypothetical protein [Leptolyngbya boryana]WNZ44468.1 hypothetical protein Q2T42_21955 [Leptolyngbya boryana CZ1]